MADGITDEMIEKATAILNRAHSYLSTRDLAQEIVETIVAGRAVVDLPSDRKWIEFCRACRDERDEIVPADFILWGKLLPSEQLGPRCYNHATAYIGVLAMTRIDQWAVFDLRPLNRALTQSTEASGGVL